MSATHNPTKAIFCALSCEAKPIIEALNLKKSNCVDYFPTFTRENLHLLVTGLGGSSAAAAVNFAMGRFSEINEIINIGICGAASQFEIGRLAVPSKIVLNDSRTAVYPELLLGGNFFKGTLGTFNAPVRSPIDGIDFYDMEGWHVFNEASRYICPSRVSTIKIISDNLADLPKSKNEVEALIKKRVPEILDFMDLQSRTIFTKVKQLIPAEEDILRRLSREMRLTLSQQRQLGSAARDLKARGGDLSTLSSTSKPEFQTTAARDQWLNEVIQFLHRV